MSTEADNAKNHEEADQSSEKIAKKRESRRKKRMRAQGSQTDDEALSDGEQHEHGCSMCNTKLNDIQGKLDKLLSVLPEIQDLKIQVAKLEKEKEELRASLESTQAEVEVLKEQASVTAATLKITTDKIVKLEELERRVVKQECFNRRNNIKFFGISDNEQESPEDTEAVLRNFLHKEMKLSKKHLDDIEFERVHRIPTRVREEKINQHPRPIIAKVSFFKDKQQIKSHIKHLPKGKKFGVADDFPKEVDEIRKELYPVLKQAKRDHKTAFFNVEKLIIDKAVYRGPETKKFTLYGRIMDNI